MPLGRPSIFNQSTADEICLRLSLGESLLQICRDEHMPTDACVRQWALKDVQGFYSQYAHARDIGLDHMNDRILELASDKSRDANCRRVELDTIKWYLSKMAPKRYGDRLELAGSVDTSKGWADIIRERRAKRAGKSPIASSETSS